MVIKLKGRIDSSNAAETEMNINEQLGDNVNELILDVDELEYISSAGLRVILRLKKQIPNTKVINCNSDIYDIFDMTGFSEMMEITKAFRKISIDNCEIIGEGANGIVYRTDPDTIVKVYKMPDSLNEINKERELARKAFVMGIPTAIPYDVVKVGDLYGSVFEMLNAKSFAVLLEEGEDIDKLVEESVDILKIIHSTTLKNGELPNKKFEGVKWAEYCVPYLPKEVGEKLVKLFKEIPETNNMIHGDYHIKNIMRQGKENLLIDMDTLSLGHIVFEFAQMYITYHGYSEIDHNDSKRFFNVDYDTIRAFWNKSLKCYFNNKDDAYINSVVDKARIIAYTRMLRRSIKHKLNNDVVEEHCKKLLTELVPVTDSLSF
ncbi:MAG: STAS domain-containing protein [Clostridia bacterium]|nr:STAS domain-containing protein [Clostridia bacterium]